MSEECANPLLLGWIKEWLEQARERNSKGVTVFVPDASPEVGSLIPNFGLDTKKRTSR